MASADNAPAIAALPCPVFPADNAHKYLLDTSTCIVWDTQAGQPVRREWARKRGLPRLVFASDLRPQLGQAIKRGLVMLGYTVDTDKPRWPSVHGQSGIEHGAASFALAACAAVPRGRPSKVKPPTYGAFISELNLGKALPAFVPIDPNTPDASE